MSVVWFQVRRFYLNSVHRAGGERGVGEGLGGTQQVAHTVKVVLVLLDGLNAHPLSRQQGLVAGGIAGWGHEFEVSMTTAKKETSPGEPDTGSAPVLINLTEKWLCSTGVLYGNSSLKFIRFIIKENTDLISLPIP